MNNINISHKQTAGMVRKVLLICGIISSMLYLIVDIAASVHWKGFYDYASQSFSELMAYEAPTRTFVLSFNILYNVLIIAFGLSVRVTGNRKISFRITGILLIGYAIVGIVTPAFFPSIMRGVEATVRNTMHLPFTGLEVLFILSSIGFGAAALGKRFRIYSIFTLAVIVPCGILGATFVSKVALNQPTPWLGIIERGNIYGYMLWVLVLAVILLRMENNRIKSVENALLQP